MIDVFIPLNGQSIDTLNWFKIMVPVALAIAGFLFTYFHNKRLISRKAELDRVNRQLSDLYGPLYALSIVGDESWKEFRKRYRVGTGAFFNPKYPIEAEDVKAWKHWMKTVFMPKNLEMYEVVTNHTDLIVEDEMPKVIVDLLTHIAVYNAVLENWESGNEKYMTSTNNFPKISEYASDHFKALKKEQAILLGQKMSD